MEDLKLLTRTICFCADVFDSFKNEEGDFESSLSEDIRGMLSLYEASFLLMEDETNLEKAKDLTSKSLKDFVSKNPTHDRTEIPSETCFGGSITLEATKMGGSLVHW